MHKDFIANMVSVDNTKHNIGIMESHNRGINYMRERGADWLIVISAAIRFGEPGGMDFVKQLEDQQVVEAADVFGWHLIAFSRGTIEKVGRWDENFTPYGYDDLDYSYRFQLANDKHADLWEKVPVDVKDMGMAHSIKKAGVTGDDNKLQAYYRKKWGVFPGQSHDKAYKYPFNKSFNPVGYWPQARPLGGQWDD